jgi:hypothetical protein
MTNNTGKNRRMAEESWESAARARPSWTEVGARRVKESARGVASGGSHRLRALSAEQFNFHQPVQLMIRRTLGLSVFFLLALGLALPVEVAAQDGADVRGAWSAQRYVLATGAVHEVRGQIFFAERDWQVLFFVMGEEGPERGSGEGGTYERTEDGVVFSHLFNLSVGEAMEGLEEAPLRMTARGAEGAPLEPTRLDVEGDVLTLYFPSGNRMMFRKSS